MVILAFPAILTAQRAHRVCGEYTYYAPKNLSQFEAETIAIERARLQAISDEFGTMVDQTNLSLIQNRNGESHTDFFSLGETAEKGEWLEDTSEPQIESVIEDGMMMQINAFNKKMPNFVD